MNQPINQVVTRKQGLSTGSWDAAVFAVMEREDCLLLWTALFGSEPPKYTSVPFMRQALAHEAQLDAFGGYSSAVERALKDAWKVCEATQNGCSVKDADKGSDTASRREKIVSATASFALKPGTHLVREWNGRTYQVEVTEGGFRLDGKDYDH